MFSPLNFQLSNIESSPSRGKRNSPGTATIRRKSRFSSSVQIVKALGVIFEDILLRIRGKILSAPDDHGRFRPAHIPMRIIRRVHQGLRADLIDDVAHHFFFRLQQTRAVAARLISKCVYSDAYIKVLEPISLTM